MRRPIAFVGLALLCGAVLSATVFRNDIAKATGLAQKVTVNNTSSNPVPVTAPGTELVIQHTFTGSAAISNIDVSKYKEIRVAFNPQGVTCAIASLTITGPAGPLDEMKACGPTLAERNKTYDVPGLSLELEFAGGGGDQATVTVYGRTN